MGADNSVHHQWCKSPPPPPANSPLCPLSNMTTILLYIGGRLFLLNRIVPDAGRSGCWLLKEGGIVSPRAHFGGVAARCAQATEQPRIFAGGQIAPLCHFFFQFRDAHSEFGDVGFAVRPRSSGAPRAPCAAAPSLQRFCT